MVPRRRNNSMAIDECCKENVVTASPNTSIMAIIGLMKDRNIGSVVIIEKKKPVGIITDRDIILRVIADGKDLSKIKVKDVMTKKPVVLPDDIGLFEALKQMEGKKFRRFPIVDAKGHLKGIITVDDLMSHLISELSVITGIIEGQGPNF